MAGRRTARVTIAREGRDKGAIVAMEEMPATQSAEWLMRAGMLLARGGVDVPADIAEHGVTGFVALGVGTILTGLGKAPWSETKPLLDELLTCVTGFQPAGGAQMVTGSWALYATQIEEPTTIFQIYQEVLSLIVGFSVAAALSTFVQTATATILSAAGRTTEISPERSESSSGADTPA